MRQLSEEQRAAVEAVNGQVLVISCPGSGKTTVLIERLKYMLNLGISSTTMLNITFTKAAAEEMEKRFLNDCNCKMRFSTIHSLCFQILCKEFNFNFDNILKESEKWMFIGNKLLNKIPSGEMEEMIKLLISEVSYVKNKGINPKLYQPLNCKADLFYEVFATYEEYKADMKKMDFDDMLILCYQCLTQYPEILQKYQDIYQYISVDEFQDVNSIQAEICYMLAGKNGNLFVVGDDDQSIYKFRAADSSIMLSFPKKFPNCKTIYMGTNYRSGKAIVNIAGKLIKNNRIRFQKDFRSYKQEDGNIFIAKYEDSNLQAKNIVSTIMDLNKNKKLLYEDMAILYRTNSLSIPFIAQLIKLNIPFYTSEIPKSHHDFIYEDIMSYYRLSQNQQKIGDIQKILNHPSRYLKSEYFKNCNFNMQELLTAAGKATPNSDKAKDAIIEMMYDIKQLHKITKPKDFINYLSNNMNYRQWLIQFSEFMGKTPDENLAIFGTLLEEASEFDNMNDWILYVKHYELKLKELKKNKKKNGICLSTFHSAKGLEWNTVFVANVNEGITPFVKAETPADLEEERRMFYVAITRAKMQLFLTYIEGIKSLHSPYFEEMGFFIKSIGIGDSDRKLDIKNGLGVKN